MSEPRTDAKICGMGHSMKRKEDPRFIRGQGRYIDDHVLPGMLYMDIVRSPHAHARIKKIDTSKALKVPGVLAVIDGPTLAKYNLHWMPTLSSDTQMVLPIDEVMYQAQEGCAVIATERYIAADGVDAVEVEYEPLPVMGDPFKSLVPVSPGHGVRGAGSGGIGKPVKWIEDRMENLQADAFARDYHMKGELGAKKDGTMASLKIKPVAHHGYPNASANPSKFPAGLFSICTGSYDLKHAFCEVDAAYTHKPPGGVAYRCSFRVTEAVHAIERATDALAQKLNMDPAELRMKNFIKPEQFPYKSVLGWEYDSVNYGVALKEAMDIIGYDALRREQAEKRKKGELMGIGICSFTEIVGAGPSKQFDILGIKMFDSAEIRVHPTGKAIARFGTKSQGQGHETTYAQIVAEELGIPAAHIQVEEGDTDTAPYGLGTYASRSTPTSGASAAMASRKIRDEARKLAAHLLELSEDDLEWEPGN